MTACEVAAAPAHRLREPLQLLEAWLRDGEPVPETFAEKLRRSVEAGDTEVLAARADGRTVGVLVLDYRLNASLGGLFASVEDLYVVPEARRGGVGTALLQAAGERCTSRGISYLEAQVEEGGAAAFYGAFGFVPEPGVRAFSLSVPPDERPDEKPGSGG